MSGILAAAVRSPRRTTLLASAAVLVSLAAAARLRLRSDLFDLLPSTEPAVAELRAAVEDFGIARRLLVAVEADSAADLAAAAPRIEAYFGEVAAMPGVLSIETGIPSGVLKRLAGADGVRLLPRDALARLRERLGPEGLRAAAEEAKARLGDADAAAARELVLADPLDLRGMALSLARLRPRGGLALPATDGSLPLLSEDGRMRLLVARADRPPEDLAFATDLVRGVRSRFRAALRDAGLRLTLAGAYPIAAEAASRMRSDLLVMGSAAFLAVLVLAGLLFRSARVLVPVGAALLVAILGTAGVAGAAFGEIHLVSVGFASTLVGLGVNFGLHVASAYAHGLEAALAPSAAAAAAARGLARGLLVSAATTAGAFGVLLFSSFRGYAEFGLLLAAGIALACACSLLLLPAWLARGGPARPDPLRDPARRLGEAIVRRRGAVRVAAVALLLACGGLAAGLEVRTGTETLRPDLPAFDEQARVLSRFGNVVEPLVLTAYGASLEAAIEANDALFERLAAAGGEGRGFRIHTLRYFLLSRSSAAKASALFEGLDAGEASMDWQRALRGAGFREAYAEEQAARLRRLLEDLRQPPPGIEEWRVAGLGPTLEGSLAVRGGRARIATTVYPEDTTDLGEAIARVRAAAGPGVAVTGLPIVRGRLASLVAADLNRLGAIAFLLLIAILAATLRSVRGVLVSLVPFLASALGAAAALRLAGRGITVGNLAVFPLLTGMADDYGIHLWLRFREGGDAARALATCCRALVTSGLTTILGFGALLLSAHPALRDLGLAAAAGVAFALASSLLLVPALLPAGRARAPADLSR